MIASAADLAVICDRLETFHKVSHWSDVPVNRANLEAYVLGMIERGAVFLGKRGVLGVVLQPLYFNQSVNLCVEVFFHGLGDGPALRREAEQWAAGHGCAFVAMAGSEARSASFFTRAGYRPFAFQYLKGL